MGIDIHVMSAFTFEYQETGFTAYSESYEYQCEAFQPCYSKFNMHSNVSEIPI